ncbi:bacterial regulatory helix-turn-helix s, AraC family protein [Clostridioides difficile CD160]|nr:bacterial regulatory helix-turn-helix s, AraC family protein [Clostridioides difficile CD160]
MDKNRYSSSMNETTIYKVFSGIELIYNNYNVSNFNLDGQDKNNVLEISYCLKGRVECELKDGTYLYLGEGDLGINMLDNPVEAMNFPLEHYEGISVNLYLDTLSKHLPEILENDSVDIYSIKDKFCMDDGCFVMRATKQIEHLFYELYKIPDDIKEAHLKMKVIELLLSMSVLNKPHDEKKENYYKYHVKTIKQIQDYITKNYAERYTIDELSKKYFISLTTLKVYFKEVYGMTIVKYMKNYRMKKATELLRDTSSSISDIALAVSYESQSKFAITFKEVYGMSPLEYRRKVLLELD